MSGFIDLAVSYYKEGLSCSESIIKAAQDTGICKFNNINEIHMITSMFSGGMSSGCLCGAVAASQMVLGNLFGRNISEKTTLNREVAAEFIQKFKEQRKVTCCNALSSPYKNDLVQRKQNCYNIVADCAQIIENLLVKHSKELKV